MNEKIPPEETRLQGLFNESDRARMAGLGMALDEALRQIELFRNPPPYANVLRPCRLGDGIRRLPREAEPWLLARFEEAARQGRVSKMVPASGAATRMFKELLADLNQGCPGDPPAEVRTFLDNLPRFAFYEDLAGVEDRGRCEILEHLLTDKGMDYAELPKGLLKFHRYPEGPRTPLEEHLVEATDQTRDEQGVCRLHFTVSSQHQARFAEILEQVRPFYEERYGCRFEVTFSNQQPSTDTLAVDPDNRPFRQEDGSLLFRPGGHGSLIANLGALAGQGRDLVLLKNIDNVVPDRRKPLVSGWKKVLTGQLLALQEKVFRLLERLESGDEGAIEEALRLVETDFSRPVYGEIERRTLIEALDRPLRVCGVVRNQGEPGGGPFWVKDAAGHVSIQIVESSQIDPGLRAGILGQSTHFNPADIVCALRDRRGEPYDLGRFVDPSAVFISTKSHEGRPLKALERPGLWNGAMAGWNTVFVEVPDETFAPVKTVLDLLRPEHQG
ncbi:MAG TPA: DUF4301 family protein [Thermoanaerobaculia bacterium]|jgi:hypothetical protein|nr:DUF4301 family protein [Thermoanaerobaculia bacterium]